MDESKNFWKENWNPNWYNASLQIIQPVLEEKCQALVFLKSRPTRQATAVYRTAKSAAQATVRKCSQDYWEMLCSNMETARNSGNIKAMYKAIKTAIGPTTQTCGVLKKKDGSIIEDKSEKLVWWIENLMS